MEHSTYFPDSFYRVTIKGLCVRDGKVLLVRESKDISGKWEMPGGGLDFGEDIREGLKREIKEEIGLDIEIEDMLGENEYVASDPEAGKKRKHVTYFLARSPFVDITLENKGGLDDAQWFKVSKILELNFYEDVLPIVTKAITMLVGKKQMA